MTIYEIHSITMNFYYIFNISKLTDETMMSLRNMRSNIGLEKYLYRYDFLFLNRVKTWSQYVFRQRLSGSRCFFAIFARCVIFRSIYVVFRHFVSLRRYIKVSPPQKWSSSIRFSLAIIFRLWCCDSIDRDL